MVRLLWGPDPPPDPNVAAAYSQGGSSLRANTGLMTPDQFLPAAYRHPTKEIKARCQVGPGF